MKNRILFFLMVCIILSIMLSITICSAEELTYFYANEYTIGYDMYRILYSQNIDGFTSANFDTYLSYAKSQWSSTVTGFGIGSNTFGSTIELYGGRESTLEELEPEIVNYWALTNHIEYQWVDTYTYEGNNVKKYRFYKTKVYCPLQPFATDNSYKNMFTHELGHSVGWNGHSYNSLDVMYTTPSSSRITLTSQDKNHLIQIY